MSRKNITVGERVMAYIENNRGVDYSVIGEGIYLGDEFPEDDSVLNDGLHAIQYAKIKLDSGEIIYASEVSWGPVEKVIEFLKGKTTRPLSVEEMRIEQGNKKNRKIVEILINKAKQGDQDLTNIAPIIFCALNLHNHNRFVDSLASVKSGDKFECSNCGKDHVLKEVGEELFPIIHRSDILVYQCNGEYMVGGVMGKLIAKLNLGNEFKLGSTVFDVKFFIEKFFGVQWENT